MLAVASSLRLRGMCCPDPGSPVRFQSIATAHRGRLPATAAPPLARPVPESSRARVGAIGAAAA
jgi:hypothetical protein